MPPANREATFLRQARDRFKLGQDAGLKQRQREIEDLKFYAGEQWDSDLLQSRKGQTIGSGSNQQTVPARPSLTINKTLEPVRQVLNQERASDLGIELIPADDWGSDHANLGHEEIELREGLVRRIQREPEASDARTWGFTRAAIAGTGYWLVMTRYVPGKSQDQEIYIERIYNQSSVVLDPSHEQPDGSDAAWGFWGTDMLQSAFKAEYPDAQAALIEDDAQWRSLGDQAPDWFSGEGEKRALRVMNYVYTERKSVELFHMSDGSAAEAVELVETDAGRVLAADPTVTVLQEDGNDLSHTDVRKVIQWAKITGNEVLERTVWPGHWLPIIQVVGEELQPFDQQRRRQGVVRPMMDACKGNNYIISKFVERVGLTPIAPIIMAGGQDEGYEAEWDLANTRTLSRLHYNQKDSFGQPVPSPPFRADARAEISDIAAGVQIFGQAIQSTSVVPETALGNTDPTVKSGKLARALIEQGERGTSNFLDNLVRSLRHEGRVVNDLLYPIYGRTGRLARIMSGQGESSAVLVGQPFVSQGDGRMARPIPVPAGQPMPPDAKRYELTEHANFNVVIKVSRSIETRRQQIAEFLGNLIAASPDQMTVIGDKLWKYLDVPDHTEIEERYKVMLAPPIQQLLADKTGPTPEALQQQLQQAMQMVEMMSKELQAKTQVIETDQVKAQQQFAIEQLKQQAETERAALEANLKAQMEARKLEVQLEIEMAKLGSAQSMARAEIEQEQLHQHGERLMAAEARQAAAAEADLDRQAARDEAVMRSDDAERDRQFQAAQQSTSDA